jgi:parvulin-like peptidyl-prolyl isomerase
MNRTHKHARHALLTFLLLGAGHAMAAAPAPAPAAAAAAAPKAIFAKVGDAVVTQEEYDAAFNAASRGKFYHGKPPEAEIAALQREVGDQLVARILLVREARQRGFKADQAEVQKTVQSYDQRYANSEQWKKSRDKMLANVIPRLEEDSILAQFEKSVRNIAKPGLKEVRAYYAAHPEKFTEPEQLRVAVILLKVDPSSPTEVWIKADEEAKEIAKKLRAGADFAALARARSADGSAQQGGDMGYLHGGMLPDGTQQVLNAMKPGEISNPVQLLEGMAVFRLTDRKVAKLNSFEAVQGRAQDLLQRDQADQAWKKLIAELRKKTPAQVDQSRFLPLADNAGARPAVK